MNDLQDYLQPISMNVLSGDEGFPDTRLGRYSAAYEDSIPDVSAADIILIGCGEYRGEGRHAVNSFEAADAVRKAFYKLYHWHDDISIADLGNVRTGSSVDDSYAALRTVIRELLDMGKRVVVIGGSHDNARAQYDAYASRKQIIEMTGVDARLDMDHDSRVPAENFLLDLFTTQPNYVRHYNHIGFQSYFVHPGMLETIDKLRFDCYRVGRVKEDIAEMEPAIRHSQVFSFDISAIRHSHAPANILSPNGFSGEEACTLMQYAGMASEPGTVGIYGFHADRDVHGMTATQIAQMLWYYMDGVSRGRVEASLSENSQFNEFRIAFGEVESTFLQSKQTGRWWMEVPGGRFIPCSRQDYVLASSNEIPERWLRVAERP